MAATRAEQDEQAERWVDSERDSNIERLHNSARVTLQRELSQRSHVREALDEEEAQDVIYGVACAPGPAAVALCITAVDGCCCSGVRIRPAVGCPTGPGFESRTRQFFFFKLLAIPRQSTKNSIFFRHPSDARLIKSVITSRKIFKQANAMKSNRTYRVRL
jgi:hypothetical protein